MINSIQAEHGGVVLYYTPSTRNLRRRRRMLGVVVIAAIAASGALLGEMQGRASRAVGFQPIQAQSQPLGLASAFGHFPH